VVYKFLLSREFGHSLDFFEELLAGGVAVLACGARVSHLILQLLILASDCLGLFVVGERFVCSLSGIAELFSRTQLAGDRIVHWVAIYNLFTRADLLQVIGFGPRGHVQTIATHDNVIIAYSSGFICLFEHHAVALLTL